MAAPGFTAELSLATNGGRYWHLADWNPAVSKPRDGDVTMQNCAIDTLAFCTPWLQACFYGGCAISRAFGSGACTSCMAGCLYVTNPLMAPLCVSCVSAGPCTAASPLSGLLGCPYNVCA
jgi:hypothetical protein